MIDLKGFWRGIRAMGDYRFHFWDPQYWKLKKYDLISLGGIGMMMGLHPVFWCHLWTPKWHNKRGPYISLGLGFFAIYRGY